MSFILKEVHAISDPGIATPKFCIFFQLDSPSTADSVISREWGHVFSTNSPFMPNSWMVLSGIWQ